MVFMVFIPSSQNSPTLEMKLWLDVATAAAKSVLPSLRPFLGFRAWKAASAFVVSPKHWKTSVNSLGHRSGPEGIGGGSEAKGLEARMFGTLWEWGIWKIVENPWKSMKIHGNPWKSMKIHENPGDIVMLMISFRFFLEGTVANVKWGGVKWWCWKMYWGDMWICLLQLLRWSKMCFNTFNEISGTTWVGLTTENNAEPPSVGSRYCGSSSLTDGFSINPPQWSPRDVPTHRLVAIVQEMLVGIDKIGPWPRRQGF